MKNKLKITSAAFMSVALIGAAAFPAIAHETYYFITNYGSNYDSSNQPAIVHSSDTIQNYNSNHNDSDIIHKIAQRFKINEQELRDYIKQLYDQHHQHDENTNNNINYHHQYHDDVNDDKDDDYDHLGSNFKRYHGDRYSNHLNFIDQKLTDAVHAGKISNDQRRRLLDKLQHNMAGEENYYNARNMTEDEKRGRIASWKKDMEGWTNRNGLTLSQLREITGKGNKYLMGVDY